jgi:tetratricopeptide (TPR) repeat protein
LKFPSGGGSLRLYDGNPILFDCFSQIHFQRAREGVMKSSWISPVRLMKWIGLWFWISSSVLAQTPVSLTVYGKVFLPDGNPAANMTIHISSSHAFNADTTTNIEGIYRFEGVPPGLFELRLNQPASAPYSGAAIGYGIAYEGGGRYRADVFIQNPVEISQKKEKTAPVISTREASQNIPKEAQKAFVRGKQYREQKKLEAALKELDKAIKIFPDYFQAWTEKGKTEINFGHPRQALQDFTEALQLFSDFEPALSGAGYCHLTLGAYEQSIAMLEKAMQIDSTRVQNLLFLGVDHLALKRWGKAQEALERALRLDPNGMVTAHMYLAHALAGQEIFDRAADEMHAYLELNPGGPNADRLRDTEARWRAEVTKGAKSKNPSN